MTDLPMADISTVPALPTSEAIIAGFTPGMTASAKIAAMLSALPADGDLAVTARMPNGRAFSFCPSGTPVHVRLLEEAISDATVTLVRPELIVAATFGETSTGQGGAPMVGRAFTPISFDTVTADPYKAFDPKTGIVTIQEDGDYFALVGFRIADGDITGVSYGLGFDTVARDTPTFDFGGVGLPKRQGRQYQRYAPFKKGDQPFPFYYFDGTPSTYIAASLTILRVR